MALVGLALIIFGWLLEFLLPGGRFFSRIILILGAGLVTGAVILDFKKIRSAAASGKGLFGIDSSLAISLFAGIILLINVISMNWYHRFDFTGIERFTLSSQTKKVLKELETEVEIAVLFPSEIDVMQRNYAEELLQEYVDLSDYLSLKVIDPEVEPDQARRYGFDQLGAQLGVVVFRTAGRDSLVYGPQIELEAEHAFTNSLLMVTGKGQKRVYFLTGHDESSPFDQYQAAREGLLDNLFTVKELDLSRIQKMPSDTSVLVIAGPRLDLSEQELKILGDYLKNNGRMLLLLDPDPPETFKRLITPWQVKIEEGHIIDPESYAAPIPANPIFPAERNGFKIEDTSFFGITAFMPEPDRPADIELAPLLWTSNEAWLEKGDEPADRAGYDSEIDHAGPLAAGILLATAGTADDPEQGTRIILVGDSDFASHSHFNNGGNGLLFLTSVNWLTAGTDVVSIDRKVLLTRRLIMNPEQTRFLHFTSVGLLPFLLLTTAGIIWWRRKQ